MTSQAGDGANALLKTIGRRVRLARLVKELTQASLRAPLVCPAAF